MEPLLWLLPQQARGDLREELRELLVVHGGRDDGEAGEEEEELLGEGPAEEAPEDLRAGGVVLLRAAEAEHGGARGLLGGEDEPLHGGGGRRAGGAGAARAAGAEARHAKDAGAGGGEVGGRREAGEVAGLALAEGVDGGGDGGGVAGLERGEGRGAEGGGGGAVGAEDANLGELAAGEVDGGVHEPLALEGRARGEGLDGGRRPELEDGGSPLVRSNEDPAATRRQPLGARVAVQARGRRRVAARHFSSGDSGSGRFSGAASLADVS